MRKIITRYYEIRAWISNYVWSMPWFQWWLSLTHWGRVTHICVSDLTIIGSDNGLSPGRRQAIIRTNAVNKTLRNKLQWNWNRNSNIFIEENAFESVVCEKAAIMSRPQCVNWLCWRNYLSLAETRILESPLLPISKWVSFYQYYHLHRYSWPTPHHSALIENTSWRASYL